MNRWLLTILLVMSTWAPAQAEPKNYFQHMQDRTLAEEVSAEKVINATGISTKEKFQILQNRLGELAGRESGAQDFCDWFIDGISRAVRSATLKVQDSIPEQMENADIPEFLVKQTLNSVDVKKLNKPSVLYVGVSISQDEARRLSSRDDMINFMLNHEDRLFYQLEK